MRRGPVAVAIACCALLLAAGCGSSSSSSNTTTSTTTITNANGSTATTSSTGTSSSSSTPKGFTADTTPKFASPSSSAPVQGGVVQIAYRNIAIAPDTVKVKVGSTIKWTNYDSVEHNVTSKGGVATFHSKNLGEGESFEIKATKPGIIHYECTIHPTTMNGTIEVVK
jgi:plastocyanin